MAQRGRPKAIDPKTREFICTLISLGLPRWEAAQRTGTSRSTLYREAKDDPAFAEQLRTAELHQEVRPLRQIMEHMPRSWRAAAWILERQHPDVYGRRAPNTVTLADLHGIFGAMMKLLLEGVPQPEARQHVMQNFETFFQRLGGQKRSSARVRRAIMELGLEQTQPAEAAAQQEVTSDSQDGCATEAATASGDFCNAESASESAETACENPKNRAEN
jgi:hypothetical protein